MEASAPGAAGPIDPATTLGDVVLTVADLDAEAAFYRDAIGLREIRRANRRLSSSVLRATVPRS